MAEPVRAHRLTQDEGRRLQQLVRRGKHDSVRVRRAVIIMASASGTPVPAIARLVAAHEDTVRDVIHPLTRSAYAPWTLNGRAAVPARSVTTMKRSSSRRPPHALPSSGARSPAGACANSPVTSPPTPAGNWTRASAAGRVRRPSPAITCRVAGLAVSIHRKGGRGGRHDGPARVKRTRQSSSRRS